MNYTQTRYRTNRQLDYLSTAKYLFDTSMECFNNCTTNFDTKDVIPIERHCAEGCIQLKLGLFSRTAISGQKKQ